MPGAVQPSPQVSLVLLRPTLMELAISLYSAAMVPVRQTWQLSHAGPSLLNQVLN